MLKRSCFSIMTAALFLLPLCLSASAAKVHQVRWTDPGADPAAMDNRFVPYGYDYEVNPTPDDKSICPTSFRVECSAYFWGIDLFLEDPTAGLPDAADNVVEIFFCPTKDRAGKQTGAPDYGDGRYYQFYGSVRDHEIDFYYYGMFDRHYTPIREWNVSYDVEKGKGYRVRLMLSWENFMYTLPLEQDQWLFNIVRSRGNAVQKWEGVLHEPKTWGRITFPKMTEEQKAEILTRIVSRLADKAFRGVLLPFNPERFNNRSFNDWKIASEKKLSELNATLRPDVETGAGPAPAVVQNAFKAARTMADTRICVDSWPERRIGKAWSSAKNTITFQVPPDDGVVYLTNLGVGNTKGKLYQWTVQLDGKKIAGGNISDLPVNVRIGELPKGGAVSVSVAPLDNLPPDVVKSMPQIGPTFAVERFMNGLMPGPAFIIHNAPLTIPSPKRLADGTPLAGSRGDGYLERLQKMQKTGKTPRVFFVGDSITAGLNGSAWNRLEKFRPLNLGFSGDWIQNVLWRVDLAVFEQCKPELVVLMIGTNNSTYPPEDIAAGVAEILKHVRQRSPGSKILLLGILPRGTKLAKDSTIVRANQLLSKLADAKTVFYLDAGKSFLEADGVTVRGKLFLDGLHPNEAGNNAWVDAMLPSIEKLLPPEKK